jgi:hypothetical protein
MIHRIVPSEAIGRILTCLMLLAGTGVAADDHGEANAAASGPTPHVTHILGFEGISSNASGDLSIEGDALRFKKSDGSGAQITIGSIQDVSLGEEDKQVGGVPLVLGRVATPFEGGRVIALFSHKKYDTVTLQYLDANGGFHGAVFQLNKGQGRVVKNELVAQGARVTPLEDQARKQAAPEANNDGK